MNENPLKRKKVTQLYERDQVAKQIRTARSVEIGKEYAIDHDFATYLCYFGGLKNFLEYIRTLDTNLVLDIGTGVGKAAKELVESPMGQGLDIQVTTLTSSEELRKNFTKEKIHITSVEALRGIKDNSVAGIIAFGSIPFTTYPASAIDRINQVLIPGGAVKIVFPAPRAERSYKGLNLKGPELFIKHLESLGYDVSKSEHKFTTPDDLKEYNYKTNIVVVAIKSGNLSPSRAQELLNSDRNLLLETAEGEYMGVPILNPNKLGE